MKKVQILKKESSEDLQKEIRKFIEGVGPLADIIDIQFVVECDAYISPKHEGLVFNRHLLYFAFIIYTFEKLEL
jgi:hypothetical protein